MTPDKVEAALGVLAKCEPFVGWDKDRQAFREALSVLTEALAERERDAARYRWVVTTMDKVSAPIQSMWGEVTRSGREYPTKEEWDTAIDAAMKEPPHAR